MKVTSYGLFWRRSEVEWWPGQGIKQTFRLLGSVGKNKGSVRVADFRMQQGIYILYNEYGASYVGLTQKQGLGKRLKDHTADHLQSEWSWDRFSWFGFNEVGAPGIDGVLQLRSLENDVTQNTFTTIRDLEALLMRAIGPRDNGNWTRFKDASEWQQVKLDECDKYLSKVGSDNG